MPTNAKINHFPPQSQINKLHPFYDYESYLKSKTSLEKHYVPEKQPVEVP